jgi:hypothetical protein
MKIDFWTSSINKTISDVQQQIFSIRLLWNCDPTTIANLNLIGLPPSTKQFLMSSNKSSQFTFSEAVILPPLQTWILLDFLHQQNNFWWPATNLLNSPSLKLWSYHYCKLLDFLHQQNKFWQQTIFNSLSPKLWSYLPIASNLDEEEELQPENIYCIKKKESRWLVLFD